MRKLSLIFLSILFLGIFSSCEEKKERYTTKSDNIDKLKSGITAYAKGDWDTWMQSYSDSSKIYYNNWDEALSSVEAMKTQKDLISKLSSYAWRAEPQFYEQTIDDEGETWVNYWGVWEGKLKGDDKQINIPVHLSAKMKDGKIIEEYGFWNMAELVGEMQKKEAMKNMPVEQKKLLSQSNLFVDEFINKNNTGLINDIVVTNFVRTANGKTLASNSQELISSYDVLREGFPDTKVTANNTEISGNDVFVNWTFRGTHNGEYNGMAPTGRKVTLTGISKLQFNGEGKIVRQDLFYNEMDLMNQLGYKLEKGAN